MPDNVKDLSNVRIVTLILDTRTGEILNADLCSLSDIPDTSISNITTDDNKRHDIFNSLSGSNQTSSHKASLAGSSNTDDTTIKYLWQTH